MRLIDADKFEAFNEKMPYVDVLGYIDGYVHGMEKVLEEIDAALTIDAVPVVRCRDCKKGWPAGEYVYCMKPYAGHWPTHKWDWYCADGERKEDET